MKHLPHCYAMHSFCLCHEMIETARRYDGDRQYDCVSPSTVIGLYAII